MFESLMNVQQGALATAALDAGQAEELQKTLQAGHGYLGAPGSLVGGAASQLESIDSVLRSVTYDAKNIVLWSSIPQDQAYSLVEQFVRTNAYGDGGSPYIPESGSPAMNTGDMDRHAMKVCFFATRRGVSVAATMVRQNFGGDLEGRETQNGTLWLLERLERELYKGLADFSNVGAFDGSVAAQPIKLQNLNIQGLEVQIRAGDQDYSAMSQAMDGFGGNNSVISDLAGETLQEGNIQDEANVIVENFGMPGELHMEPKVLSNFVQTFYPKERVNTLGIMGSAGYLVTSMMTTAGQINLRPNVFLKAKQAPKTFQERAGVPSAPASASAAAVVDGTTKLKAGSYVYEVASANEQGEGATTVLSSAVTIASDGDYARVTIAQPASGNVPSHYAVYRSGGTNIARQFIGYVARSGANTIFTDKGAKIEGGSTAYMLDLRNEIVVWKQLCPMQKLNLAQVTLAKEFILWLAGCAIVFAPRKLGVFQNISRS